MLNKLKSKWLWIILVIIIIALIVLVPVLRKKESSYITETVTKADIVQTVEVTGSVESADDIDLNFNRTGTLQAVLVKMKQRLKDFCRDELNSHEFKSSHVDEMLVVSGRPSEEIIKTAEKNQADLIVLGKSSRNVLGSDVSGSTSRRVSRYSSIPVLVVPNQ